MEFYKETIPELDEENKLEEEQIPSSNLNIENNKQISNMNLEE